MVVALLSTMIVVNPGKLKLKFSSPNSSHKLLQSSSPPLGPLRPYLGRPICAHAASLKNGALSCSQSSAGGPTRGDQQQGDKSAAVPSAAALSAAIREASSSPVEIAQRLEQRDGRNGMVLPSLDFQRLCIQQLDLFRTVVDPHAVLSVYVRPAGSYVMDRLELRRVSFYPDAEGFEAEDVLVLIVDFCMPTGLRSAEAVLSNCQAHIIQQYEAIVFPLVKHPFVVGFLVAELPTMKLDEQVNVAQQVKKSVPIGPTVKEPYGLPSRSERNTWNIQAFKDDLVKKDHHFPVEQETKAVKIALSLAMAYVMDQKAMLLQQSSWQNNVRMNDLVEQIRGPLSSIRTLSKLLSTHMKKNEISYDIVEDILVQGDRIRDTLQQLQDAVYVTKANIIRYNEEILKKMHRSSYGNQESRKTQLLDSLSRENWDSGRQGVGPIVHGVSRTRDLEMPMPPLALAAVQQHGIRPCNVSDILEDLVGAALPLASKQDRIIKLSKFSCKMLVAIEESALRQALSNLIEGALLRTHLGGKVEIVCTIAPAGGILILVDDDGPDMHYMTQMHSLTPFGTDLFADGKVEDNMTWNFVAGLTVAREILESYGCIVRVISPQSPDAALGAGGTHVELWLPAAPSDPMQLPSPQA